MDEWIVCMDVMYGWIGDGWGECCDADDAVAGPL